MQRHVVRLIAALLTFAIAFLFATSLFLLGLRVDLSRRQPATFPDCMRNAPTSLERSRGSYKAKGTKEAAVGARVKHERVTVYSFLYAEKARLKDYRKRGGPKGGFVYFCEAVEKLQAWKGRGAKREAAWQEIKPPRPKK
jgi:hypothetical protein